jgi:hypothetical protein
MGMIYAILIMLTVWRAFPNPPAQTPVNVQFWPMKFVTGMRNPRVAATGSGLRRDSVIQINGRTITTNSTHVGQFSRLEAEIPISLLAAPGVFQITVYTPPPNSWRSAATEMTVVPSRQPVSIEIGAPKTRVGPKEELTLTVRVTNLGSESFYVPVRFTLEVAATCWIPVTLSK